MLASAQRPAGKRAQEKTGTDVFSVVDDKAPMRLINRARQLLKDKPDLREIWQSICGEPADSKGLPDPARQSRVIVETFLEECDPETVAQQRAEEQPVADGDGSSHEQPSIEGPKGKGVAVPLVGCKGKGKGKGKGWVGHGLGAEDSGAITPQGPPLKRKLSLISSEKAAPALPPSMKASLTPAPLSQQPWRPQMQDAAAAFAQPGKGKSMHDPAAAWALGKGKTKQSPVAAPEPQPPIDSEVQALAGRVQQLGKQHVEVRDAWISFCNDYGDGVRNPTRHDAVFLQNFLDWLEVDVLQQLKEKEENPPQVAPLGSDGGETPSTAQASGKGGAVGQAAPGSLIKAGLAGYAAWKAAQGCKGVLPAKGGKVDISAFKGGGKFGKFAGKTADDNLKKEHLIAGLKGLQRNNTEARDAWKEYCDTQAEGVYFPHHHSVQSLQYFLEVVWREAGSRKKPVANGIIRPDGKAHPKPLVAMSKAKAGGKACGKAEPAEKFEEEDAEMGDTLEGDAGEAVDEVGAVDADEFADDAGGVENEDAADGGEEAAPEPAPVKKPENPTVWDLLG